MANGLLPLNEIVAVKKVPPRLIENVEAAVQEPAQTLADYLFTTGIRGHFERIFRDIKEGRGGGYWVQAEYGGGKTHFLASLLCLLSDMPDDVEAETWSAVGDADFREQWERVVRPRKLLGAHLSLMGTTAVLGSRQERLLDLIDDAIIRALAERGIADPGISASSEALAAMANLDPGVRDAVDRAFRSAQGMTVEEHRDQYGDDARTAKALVHAAEGVHVDLLRNRQVQEHAQHVLSRLAECGFDGLLVVIDEYLSREQTLEDAQKNDDAAVLETLGYKLGLEGKKALYVVVASQAPPPAKLQHRLTPLTLLSQDNEYSEIVCKRVLDYLPGADEQAALYHRRFASSFKFLRAVNEQVTREIFPFQPAVFRFLRDLVSAPRVSNLPSARFAIGVAYDAIASGGVLAESRFVTTADLMSGSLAALLAGPVELQRAANALRQAREYIENSDWPSAALPAFARRVVDHLYLDSMVRDKGQTIEQIVEGTLIEDATGMLPASAVVRGVLAGLKGCEQIANVGDTWAFAATVREGERFDDIFGREKRLVRPDDGRLVQKWGELLTANTAQAGGVTPFLSPVVQGLQVESEHCGVVYPGRSAWVPRNLLSQTQALERLTKPERVRVLFVPDVLTGAPRIDDPAIAVVAPGPLPTRAIEQLRNLVACEQIAEEYRARTEVGADAIKNEAEKRAREATRTLVNLQREVYAEGEVFTRDGLALQAKQCFRDPNIAVGVKQIANALVKHAYGSTAEILKGVPRAPMKAADAQKVFDAIFGGQTSAQAKGSGELFGPLLGLSAATDPLRLTAVPGGAVDALARFIDESGGDLSMADVYGRFSEDPFGLPKGAVDLMVFACVGLGRPFALEIRAGVRPFESRSDRPRATLRVLRSAQLGHIAWPLDGLTGATIQRSQETSWNDFVPIAQAVDRQRFSMASDAREVEAQQKAFIERLATLYGQWDELRRVLRDLRDGSGSEIDKGTVELIQRVKALADLRENFDRDAAIRFVGDTWGAEPDGTKAMAADMAKFTALLSLSGEATHLSGRLSWFRELAALRPAALADQLTLKAPLLSLGAITANPGQLSTAMEAFKELSAEFMTAFRAEHRLYVEWMRAQRDALERVARRLPTLQRLNQVEQLGPAHLASAAAEVGQLQARIRACETPDDPKTGNGITCLSCQFRMGDLASMQPVGVNAEAEINAAIGQRSHALTAGLIGETLAAAGDNDLTAVLAVAQAGSFEDVIAKDLLTDELIVRINGVLKKSKQQTVRGSRIYEFIRNRPSLTPVNVDDWLRALRSELIRDFEDARAANPGKEITLLLQAPNDD